MIRRSRILVVVCLLGFVLAFPSIGWCQDLDNFEGRDLDKILQAAEAGNIDAQYYIGWMYADGVLVAEDDVEAAKWFRKVAEAGIPKAQNILGTKYRDGEGVVQNYGEACKWFGMAARTGFAEAQSNLGTCYASGRGVPKDDTVAVQWYAEAAKQNNAGAQYNLGLMYFKGTGVAQNNAEALRLYRSAAEQGLAIAQFELGAMYVRGKGVAADYVRAHMWINLARAQGFEKAMKAIDLLVPMMTKDQIAEAQKLAREWQEPRHREVARVVSTYVCGQSLLDPLKHCSQHLPQRLSSHVAQCAYEAFSRCKDGAK